MLVQLVTFTPPAYLKCGRNSDRQQVCGLTAAYKKVFEMSDREIDAALKGEVKQIKCTAEQLMMFMIERSVHVSINRFTELKIKVCIQVESNDVTDMCTSRVPEKLSFWRLGS